MNQQAAVDRSWRQLLGRKGPGPYAVVDGRVLTDGIEIIAVHHCNLRCRACAYLSPVRPRTVVDSEALRQDLRILATRYHASEARVLGGEPLLHPDLVAVLDAVRISGICDTIRVLTNGLLLHRMTTEFWSTIDAVSVSMYQDRCIDEAAIEPIRQTAEGHGVRINFKPFRYFRESYSELGTPNQALTERIYRTCQMANVWRCHTLWSGHLFRCPQTSFFRPCLPKLTQRRRSTGCLCRTIPALSNGSWIFWSQTSRSGHAPTVSAALVVSFPMPRLHAASGVRCSRARQRN